MAARKRTEAVNDAAKAAVFAGPVDAEGNHIYLDPDLEKVRDEEAKALADAPAAAPRGLVEDPAIDPALIEARDAEIKRGDKKLV